MLCEAGCCKAARQVQQPGGQTLPPHVNLCVLVPLIAGEIQPELQVQGAYRGKRLQHLRLPPLEAQRQADVCLTERTGEATARSQGPAEAPVHPLPAHAPVVAARPRTVRHQTGFSHDVDVAEAAISLLLL